MNWPESMRHILDPTSVASRRRGIGGALDPGPWPTDPVDLQIEGPAKFDIAAEVPRRAKPSTVKQIRHRLAQDNYWRWRRLQKDIRWMKRRLERMGLNPEDWRSYLDE